LNWKNQFQFKLYHQILLTLHILAASIWVGGHILLSLRYLYEAYMKKDFSIISNFEKKYEPVAIPSLFVLAISGILLSYSYRITFNFWFSFSNPIERVISIKLLLLFLTVILGVHARFFILPKLNRNNLKSMTVHILLVTLTGILMLIAGSTIRFGGM